MVTPQLERHFKAAGVHVMSVDEGTGLFLDELREDSPGVDLTFGADRPLSPAGTVRAQVSRGLEELRRRLPAPVETVDVETAPADRGRSLMAVRAAVLEKLAWFGFVLDAEANEAANRAGGPRITTPESAKAAYIIPTDEELMIARHTVAVVGNG